MTFKISNLTFHKIVNFSNENLKKYKALKNTFAYMQVEIQKCYISEEHTGYNINESLLHDIFQAYRVKKTELFNITIDKIRNFNFDIEFKSQYTDIEKKIYYPNGSVFIHRATNINEELNLIAEIDNLIVELSKSKSFLQQRKLNKYEVKYVQNRISYKGIYALLEMQQLFE